MPLMCKHRTRANTTLSAGKCWCGAAVAGSMIYQWGGQPFSVENLMANARNANPMQLLILFQIVSSLLF